MREVVDTDEGKHYKTTVKIKKEMSTVTKKKNTNIRMNLASVSRHKMMTEQVDL